MVQARNIKNAVIQNLASQISFMNIYEALSAVLISWNLLTFALMGVDKSRAESKKFRISEKTFFISAFLFGGLGVSLGMSIFRHKTKHSSFRILIPLSIVENIIAGYFLFKTSLFY